MGRTAFSRAMFRLFRRVAALWPKSRRIVLFGSRRGLWYTDSTRQVFEWMINNEPHARPVWVTRDDEVLRSLRAQGLPVVRASSLRGVYLLMRARLGVTSAQLHDIAAVPECVPDTLRIVFLGHGKSVKSSSLAKPGGRSSWSRWVFERSALLTDAAISTSPFITEKASMSNGIEPERFHVTGYPDNDLLLEPPKRLHDAWRSYLDDTKAEHVVLYAPTWRKDASTRFFPFDDHDPAQLASFLEKHRTLLLLRPHERDMLDHPENRDRLRRLSARSPWIRLCGPDDYAHVNHLLPFVDLLVSDYSSITNDYLLLDRPMVFVPYDHDSFARSPGFMYDYFGTLPGPAVYNERDFLRELQDGLTGRDGHRERRRRLRSLIHAHTDAQATARVAGLVLDLLDGRDPHGISSSPSQDTDPAGTRRAAPVQAVVPGAKTSRRQRS